MYSKSELIYSSVLFISCINFTDKDWSAITREEVGLSIVKVIEETAVCSLDACRTDGFTLLHLAAQNGYPNMMHRLLSLKVSFSLCCLYFYLFCFAI